jgi:hypothetical protein
VTADAAKAPPKKTLAEQTLSAAALRRIERRKAEEELELVRWSPEEVVEKQLLPYKSVRSLKEKCRRREVYCHMDGGRISFSPESIRRENARTMVAPFAA